MKQEFKDLYNTLQSMPYEAHWLHTIPLGFTHIATALNKTIVYWTLLLLFGLFLLTFWEAI